MNTGRAFRDAVKQNESLFVYLFQTARINTQKVKGVSEGGNVIRKQKYSTLDIERRFF